MVTENIRFAEGLVVSPQFSVLETGVEFKKLFPGGIGDVSVGNVPATRSRAASSWS